MIIFPSKDYLETAHIKIDFKDLIIRDTIVSAETEVVTITGESAPEVLIIEATYIYSDYVVLRVSGGTPYNSYKIRCIVLTNASDDLVLEGILAISGYSSQYSNNVPSYPQTELPENFMNYFIDFEETLEVPPNRIIKTYRKVLNRGVLINKGRIIELKKKET